MQDGSIDHIFILDKDFEQALVAEGIDQPWHSSGMLVDIGNHIIGKDVGRSSGNGQVVLEIFLYFIEFNSGALGSDGNALGNGFH